MKRITKKTILKLLNKSLGYYPGDWQEAYIDELLAFTFELNPTRLVHKKSQYVTIQAPRQVGKSETVAVILACLLILIPEFCIVLGAPTLEQARNLSTKVRKWLKKFGKSIFIINQTDKVVLFNGSTYKVKSLKPGTESEGETAHLVVIDEAQKVMEEKVAETLPFLATTNGRLIALGTCNRTEICWFAKAIEQAGRSAMKLTSSQMIKYWKMSYKAIIGRDYQSVIDEFKPKMTVDEFNAHFEMVWLPQGGSLLLPEIVLRSAIASNPWFEHSTRVIGIDVGQGDPSVLVLFNVYKDQAFIEDIYYVPILPYPAQYELIEGWIRKKKANLVVVERNGPGIGCQQHLETKFKDKTIDAFDLTAVANPIILGHTVTGNNKEKDYLDLHNRVHQQKVRFNQEAEHYQKAVEELSKIAIERTGDKTFFTHSDVLPAIVCSLKNHKIGSIDVGDNYNARH